MAKLVKGPKVLYALVSDRGWGVVDTKQDVKDQLRQYKALGTPVEVIEYVPRKTRRRKA
jgi:endo-alpha-1,4-polygalactosaminidase (GH114 family)